MTRNANRGTPFPLPAHRVRKTYRDQHLWALLPNSVQQPPSERNTVPSDWLDSFRDPKTGKVTGSFGDILISEAIDGAPTQRDLVNRVINRYIEANGEQFATPEDRNRRISNLRSYASALIAREVRSGRWVTRFTMSPAEGS